MGNYNKEYLEVSKEQKLSDMKEQIEKHLSKEKHLIILSSFEDEGIRLSIVCSSMKNSDIMRVFKLVAEQLAKSEIGTA